LGIATLALLAGCRDNTKQETVNCFKCGSKEIIKTMKDNRGYMQGRTTAVVDRVSYYLFETVDTDTGLPIQYVVCTNIDLYEYSTEKLVVISGNVIACQFPFRDYIYSSDCECMVPIEYNILELKSIKFVEK
jgi:hypothetical protein